MNPSWTNYRQSFDKGYLRFLKAQRDGQRSPRKFGTSIRLEIFSVAQEGTAGTVRQKQISALRIQSVFKNTSLCVS